MSPLAGLSLVILLGAAPGAATDADAPPLAATMAVDPGTAFLAATAAYDAGNSEEAATLYRRAIDAGLDSAPLWYNLGNAELRGGRLGHAIAAYLEAHAKNPRDADITANLDFARKSVKDDIPPQSPSPVLTTLFFWHYLLSRAELGSLAVALNALLWLLLSLRLWRRESDWLRWTSYALGAVLLAIGLSFSLRMLAPRRVAVVTPAEIEVYSGTSRETVVRFVLHAGTEVAWETAQPGWLRVRLPDGKQGWVAADDVTALVL